MANGFDKAYELTLVVRSQIGDEAAFTELMGRYSGRLRFFIAKMLHGRESNADDVLQEVWISAFRGLSRLKDARAFSAWIFQIARGRIAREFRQVSSDALDEVEDLNDVPPGETEESCDRELVRDLLTLLSPPHREALALRFVEDLSYEEIAVITGNSVGTVRSRIHYAKRALRRAFEEKTK